MAKTVAERLEAVVAAFKPVKDTDQYLIKRPDGKVIVVVENADGDRLTGHGTTVAEAVAALEKKVNVAQN